jgi:RIO kinase 1
VQRFQETTTMAADRSNRPRRRRFDDTDWQPDDAVVPTRHVDASLDRSIEPDLGAGPEPVDEPNWSTYRDATRGPEPVPDWVVRDPRAIDHDLGVMKSGKEAEVSLLRRELVDADPGDSGAQHGLMAVKRYRSAEHRLFHRDAGYLEGRRVRRSRETRAMATRTAFGKELIAGQWANAEFVVLSRVWSAGAAVPYPVQLLGTELMMEFIGSADGVAAPRLAQVHTTADEAKDLYAQLVGSLRILAAAGYAHGDLSAYNVLVDDGRLVIIDLPQAVDVVGNPQGVQYLRRDCENICAWFAARGVIGADATDLADDLSRRATGAWSAARATGRPSRQR